jgi:long-chain acyl-CoA synthetase
MTALRRRSSAEVAPCTYRELDGQVDAIAVGLLAAGLNPGDRVALFADNCREWLAADQAMARAGLVSVPRGTDTAPAELELILKHSGASAMIVADKTLVDKLSPEACPRKTWTLHTEQGSRFQSLDGLAHDGIGLLGSGDGLELLSNAHAQLTGEAPCTIVYTSGTTGRPKGVVLTHKNVASNVHAANSVLHLFPGGRLLSILPSWHMFERIIEYVAISNGCEMIYTDQRRLKDDMGTERPHCVAFVPRIWERLAHGLRTKLDAAPSWKRRLVEAFRDIGTSLASGEGGYLARKMHSGMSRVLLKPMWKAFGGSLQLGVSGGGSLPEEVDRFLLSLGIPLVNGYGLTETSPVLSVRRASGNRLCSVGPPLPLTEIKIAGSDNELGAGEVGEIVVRGPQVMQGYYKDPEQTSKVLDEDGWLRTGDLGSLDNDGWLYITGRCKDTIVLAGGENVEPEPVEGRLSASPWISQVMLVGQDRRVAGALVVPEQEHVETQLGTLDDPRLHDILREELDRLLDSDAGFRPVDRVGPFAIVAEPWTTENGCMTATLKLRRHVIAERHAAEINALYDRG